MMLKRTGVKTVNKAGRVLKQVKWHLDQVYGKVAFTVVLATLIGIVFGMWYGILMIGIGIVTFLRVKN